MTSEHVPDWLKKLQQENKEKHAAEDVGAEEGLGEHLEHSSAHRNPEPSDFTHASAVSRKYD